MIKPEATEEQKLLMSQLTTQNEKLAKKLLKMKKKMLQLAEESNNQKHELEKELAKKAEKEGLIESQKQFFENMAKIES